VIVGTVSADGVPTITLSIARQERLAIIDTGFNGDLELPEDLRVALNARYVGRVTSALAGGQRLEEDVYVVEFPFDGHILRAEATFVVDAHILIGTHLLRRYQLHIDFVDQSVQLIRKS
jgi:predicted aspartyl protease